MIEVLHAGRAWQLEVRAPTVLDLLRAGASLPLFPATLAALAARGEVDRLPLDAHQEGMLRLREILSTGKEGITRAVGEQVGWLIAGVVALGVDVGPEPVTLVAEREAEHVPGGRVWVGRLPAPVRARVHASVREGVMSQGDNALIARLGGDPWLLDTLPMVVGRPAMTVEALLSMSPLALNLQFLVALHAQARGMERIDQLNSRKVPVFPAYVMNAW